MAYSVGFWNWIAKSYAKKPVPNESVYRKKLEITRQYLHPESEVFEFACGTGSTAIHHAPEVKRYTAIDVSPKMIAIARNKLDSNKITNLSFDVAALENYHLHGESSDAVLAMSILHLLDDPERAISRIHQTLKPGGAFIISSVCLSDSFAYLRFVAPLLHAIKVMPKLNFFSEKKLLDTLTRTGFAIDFNLEGFKKTEGRFIVCVKS